MPKDEFAFIQSLTSKKHYRSSVIKGIGDDTALFQHGTGVETLICVDTLIENIHFRKDTLKPFHIGYKALAVNVSDIAAMGGVPTYYLVSIAIPKETWSMEELAEVFAGMNKLASEFEIDLIGGDTVSTNSDLVITITAVGTIEKNRHLFRSNASAGHIVFVTGTLGASSAGLDILLEKGLDYRYCEQERQLIEQHQKPIPQIHAGRLLAAQNEQIALNDISDGIASEANEIAEASNMTLILNYDKLPKHPALSLYNSKQTAQFTLFGGEDFQLLGTVSAKKWPSIQEAFSASSLLITEIGHVEAGEPSVFLVKNGSKQKLKKHGYNHFS